MKLSISTSIFLLALTSTAFAAHPVRVTHPVRVVPAPIPVAAPPKVYMGFFGGGGSSNSFNASQYGTAFYPEAAGGPLAVNAFGSIGSESVTFFGLQLGYTMQDILLNPFTRWTFAPAFELEGFFMGDNTFDGSLSNDTARLPEHDFDVSYQISRNVFLANLVIGFNNPCYRFHPYIGFGIGSAILRITDADATQVGPPEPGVNHYNASVNANDTTFAGQIKIGLSYDINEYLSLFADYRWLYVGSSSYVFGSTVFPGHPETSSWQVNLDAQRFNLGDIGLRVNIS